jgi:hypothetical protein
MDGVPDYLLKAVQIAGQVFFPVGGEQDEESVISSAMGLRAPLEEWIADDDFWGAAEEVVGPVPSPAEIPPFGVFMDEELELLTAALHGDSSFATLILANMPLDGGSTTPGEARNVVIQLNVTINQVVEAPPGPSRKWRAIRLARKALTIAAGGLLIAVDVVSPDPTMLSKVASVTGGLATISSAVD